MSELFFGSVDDDSVCPIFAKVETNWCDEADLRNAVDYQFRDLFLDLLDAKKLKQKRLIFLALSIIIYLFILLQYSLITYLSDPL